MKTNKQKKNMSSQSFGDLWDFEMNLDYKIHLLNKKKNITFKDRFMLKKYKEYKKKVKTILNFVNDIEDMSSILYYDLFKFLEVFAKLGDKDFIKDFKRLKAEYREMLYETTVSS